MRRILVPFLAALVFYSGPLLAKKSEGKPFGSSVEEMQTILSGGVGLEDYGRVGVALTGSMLFRVSHDQPLFIGVQSGFDFLSSYWDYWYTSPPNPDTYVGIPLLAAAEYRFEIGAVRSLHPIASIALGPYLLLGHGVSVELSIQPGISWTFKHDLALQGEVRFGVLGGYFFAQPTGSIVLFL